MAWSDVEPEAHDLGVGTVVMIGRVLGKRTLRYIWRIQIIRRAVGCNQFPLLSSLRFQLIVSIARNLVSASQPCNGYVPPSIVHGSSTYFLFLSFPTTFFRRLSALSFCSCFCDTVDPCHTTSIAHFCPARRPDAPMRRCRT